MLAAKSSERLKPFGKTLRDATEFYVEHLERTKDSVFVSVAATDYQESKRRVKLSAKHLDDIRLRLGRFVAAFGNRPIKGVVAGEIEAWLHELALSPQSINNYRAIVRAFFSYALKRELVEKNPVTSVDKVKLVDKVPEIFTPKQLADLRQRILPSSLPWRYKRLPDYGRQRCCAWNGRMSISSADSSPSRLTSQRQPGAG